MMNKILVALDHSVLEKLIVEQALSLAKATQAQLMFLNVLSPESEESPVLLGFSTLDVYAMTTEPMKNYLQQWEEYKKKCLEMLRSHTTEAIAAGMTADFTQATGHPGKIICNLAETWGADLVIMGRRGNTPLGELLLGSVSQYVIHHAPCSILLVHPQDQAD